MTISAERQDRDLLEYLRVYVMVWQKIDFIWGMFLTTYIPLIGFLHFYRGEFGLAFGAIVLAALGAFTAINGNALRSHYLIANTMSLEFRSMNRSYPQLNIALDRTATEWHPRIVLVTHSAAFLGFVYLTGARFTAQSCAGQAEGWDCLRAVLSAQAG